MEITITRKKIIETEYNYSFDISEDDLKQMRADYNEGYDIDWIMDEWFWDKDECNHWDDDVYEEARDRVYWLIVKGEA